MSQKFKSGNQVKNEVALNVQKFQMASLVIDEREIFADEDLNVINVLRQAPRWLLTE
jgi:hypothetical protein